MKKPLSVFYKLAQEREMANFTNELLKVFGKELGTELFQKALSRNAKH